MEGGWIYVLMTSSDYNRYKVGLTKNNPMLRMNQLKTGDPLIGLDVAYFIPNTLGKLSKVEAALHAHLGDPIEFHSGEASEWFFGDPQDAWRVLDTIFKLLGYEVTDYFDPDAQKVVRFWAADLEFYFNPPKTDEYGFPL
ncbi:GIY-YIG nuclease family protein [Aeromonas caviae]|jgi:hypothetical protein|uniref:GIY-YIG nuclease family protein n=1 Tax=Aeromonas caviae TaxID=648 RepID=UPI0029D78F8B|nr:GIY-YIG nuclease family protein [Aeromonas caviae]MDX7710740.1 GIY-YIG nuclease family protein [Aeromonas caviae]